MQNPMIQLGRLEPVELRTVWSDEARDFTPWLAMEQNLAILGEVLEMELKLQSREVGVGQFRADPLCKDVRDDSWILIENQLERTNHSHLGQLITYTAGLKAVTIVWIARHFTEEHRAALDWLNETTADEVRLFGLKIELWKIGDSAVAPKLNSVSKPNAWTKGTAVTPSRPDRFVYWSEFCEYLANSVPELKPRQPNGGASLDVSTGWGNLVFQIGGYDDEDHIFVRLKGSQDQLQPVIDAVQKDAARLERLVDSPVIGKGKMDRPLIVVKRDGAISLNEDRSSDFEWYVATMRKLREVLHSRVDVGTDMREQ